MDWSYGVTTVPERLDKLLPGTLASLAHAGFDAPRLFVDGAETAEPWKRFGLDVTLRNPRIRPYANWCLTLGELYLRNPHADRYAIFQDDVITYRNLRGYLDRSPYPDKGYLNLYTFPENQHKAQGAEGWFPSNQLGRGALGLVFDRSALKALWTHPYMFERPQNLKRGWYGIDGGVSEAMKNAGFKEYCHSPTLLQHTGKSDSSIRVLCKQIGMGKSISPLAPFFRGEEFDALELSAG